MHGNAGNELGEVEFHGCGFWRVAALLVINLLDDANTEDELEDEHKLRLVQKFGELLVIDLVFVDVFLDKAQDGEGEEILLQSHVLGIFLKMFVHFIDVFFLCVDLLFDILFALVDQSRVDISVSNDIFFLLLNEFGGTAKFVLFALELVEEAGDEEIQKEAWNCHNLNFEPDVNSWCCLFSHACMVEELPFILVHEPISEEANVAQGDCNIKGSLDFVVQSLLCLTIVIASDDNENTDKLENVSQDHGSNGNLLIIIEIFGISQLFLSEIREDKDRVKKI